MADNARIANNFLTYQHRVPYVWGGANPHGWDCSGAVNYVMCHNLGYAIPGYRGGTFTGKVHGPNTTMWYGFHGMRNIARSATRRGDLVLWSSHMGIAVSNTHYISAYDTALGTVVEPIHGGGPYGETASFWRFTEAPGGVTPGGGGGGGSGRSGRAWNNMQRDWSHLRHTTGPWAHNRFRSIYAIQRRAERLRHK